MNEWREDATQTTRQHSQNVGLRPRKVAPPSCSGKEGEGATRTRCWEMRWRLRPHTPERGLRAAGDSGRDACLTNSFACDPDGSRFTGPRLHVTTTAPSVFRALSAAARLHTRPSGSQGHGGLKTDASQGVADWTPICTKRKD